MVNGSSSPLTLKLLRVVEHARTENNEATYASTHIFQMPKKRMDGSGKSGKASWLEFRNQECIGLGIFFFDAERCRGARAMCG